MLKPVGTDLQRLGEISGQLLGSVWARQVETVLPTKSHPGAHLFIMRARQVLATHVGARQGKLLSVIDKQCARPTRHAGHDRLTC